MQPRDLSPFLRGQPLGTSELYARRTQTPWGRRFVFEAESGSAAAAATAPAQRTMVSITVPIRVGDQRLGFVEMSSQAETETAKKELDGFDFKGRKLKVDLARPPKSNTANRRFR